MSLEPVVSMVTLGSRDIERARTFYSALGWELAAGGKGGRCVFRTAGAWLALHPLGALAGEAGTASLAGHGFRGVMLAVKACSPEQVDAALVAVETAGGIVLRSAEIKPWGDYSGSFADPDGHAWQVTYNPAWPATPDGRTTLP